MLAEKQESHPLLPSGEWEGFYCYHYSPSQHRMEIELEFKDRILTGSGVDDVAPFTWSGNYSLDKMKIDLIKKYTTHPVFYKGDIDENGIWGTWEMRMNSKNPFIEKLYQKIGTGGFHIWPKQKEVDKKQKETTSKIESEKLKEIYVEVFE